MRFVPVVVLALSAQTLVAQEPIDLAMLQRIRDEGFHRSQVMDTLGYLSDVIGPRLTGSPQMKRANEWTRDELTRFGLQHARLESWGPFGMGWSLEHVAARVTLPDNAPLVAWPKAWTAGTDGVVRGKVAFAPIEKESDLESWKGKLAGKIALISPRVEFKGLDEPLLKRWSAKELEHEGVYEDRGEARRARYAAQRRLQIATQKFLDEERPLAVLEGSERWPGVVRVMGGGSREKDQPRSVTALVVAPEQYNRLVRLVSRPLEVELELDVRVKFHDADPMAYNTLAEIPGGDKRQEVVLLGAHLDSWHAGTGTNDNAAGSAVMMEALRILSTLGARPRRTIRIALWSGEEQGLLGSRAYVREHLAERPEATEAEPNKGPLVIKPDHARLAAYFNLDSGSGRVRGLFSQENVVARPILAAWIGPIEDLGVSVSSPNRDFSTDHVSFDRVGLPAFNALQDDLDYTTVTHHTHVDMLDHAHPEDLKQAAVVMAWFAWQAAQRPEPMPRKAPAPAPPVPR